MKDANYFSRMFKRSKGFRPENTVGNGKTKCALAHSRLRAVASATTIPLHVRILAEFFIV